MYLQKGKSIKSFLLVSLRSLTKRTGSAFGSVSHKYGSVPNVTDPEHCGHKKIKYYMKNILKKHTYEGTKAF